MRLLVCALVLVATACKEEDPPLPPPGEGQAASNGADATGTAGGGGGLDSSSGSGEGGTPPLPTPADCGCLASAGDETCRTCLDEASADLCGTPAAACDDIGDGYCALIYDCIGLCPEPDAYCVDTCLGAHDSDRDAVEALVACSCVACAEACGEGACQ